MTESTGNAEEFQARLERAEEQDDETRLQTLETLHEQLEAELERDVQETR